jgi:3-deoxy-D-arabino-heptulosonate 7-phosphate (DAHP) synthase
MLIEGVGLEMSLQAEEAEAALANETGNQHETRIVEEEDRAEDCMWEQFDDVLQVGGRRSGRGQVLRSSGQIGES